MVTTRPNSTSAHVVRRTGAGLLAGAAASLGLFLTPATAVAAEPAAAPVAAQAPAPAPAQVAVDTARAQVGKAYQYGGNGPDSFDCSGLTSYAYRAAGIELPRRSADQATVGVPVASADLQPGDLVFYYEPISHVGIYVGDGVIAHAATESTGVEYHSVIMEGYNTARRIV
ncbi:Cell wall-associated hydrolase, NlpC family [Blastococcus aurantiacus]|uniref:Cell wall-associated hydrolase, NlpC family n=1 Tax=Blastococcus aurantiacus TaxID=1550231 RepID=A0A1G7KMP4_9ACTN|nr:C40 family peptidase [Blastococcus aurantiacus]SDF38492.1 Cell wall-associated hydrolase, NlpC family [Blastococcus aurantiacus]